MPVAIQVKLLRVLQERKLRRIGKNQEIDLDVRVIAASNRSLGGEVEAKTFREDLYFRLKGAEIYLPPLVERSRDVMPLAKYFAERVARRLSQVVYFSSGVVSVLEQYSWPGNVRELESAIEYAVARCNGTILVSDLPTDLRKFAGEDEERLPALISRIEDAVTLGYLIDRYAADVLRLCAGNKTLAAAKLGVDRKWIMRLEERLTTGKRQGRTHSFLGRSERAKAATSKAAS
jgi:DNA-binding NtrC family response regulator